MLSLSDFYFSVPRSLTLSLGDVKIKGNVGEIVLMLWKVRYGELLYCCLKKKKNERTFFTLSLSSVCFFLLCCVARLSWTLRNYDDDGESIYYRKFATANFCVKVVQLCACVCVCGLSLYAGGLPLDIKVQDRQPILHLSVYLWNEYGLSGSRVLVCVEVLNRKMRGALYSMYSRDVKLKSKQNQYTRLAGKSYCAIFFLFVD